MVEFAESLSERHYRLQMDKNRTKRVSTVSITVVFIAMFFLMWVTKDIVLRYVVVTSIVAFVMTPVLEGIGALIGRMRRRPGRAQA